MDIPDKTDDGIIADGAEKDDMGENLVASNEVTKVNPESLDKLCKGFVELYVDDLKSTTSPLDELNRNQEVLIETIQQENARFSEARQSLNLEEMFNEVAQYQAKLVAIKKDMVSLHERAVKLKKRSIKLQTFKEKQNGSKETSKLS